MRAIVLILRGCPAGWLGLYGNEWIVTPHLDRLASESVVFDRHISDCPEAAAAYLSWMGDGPTLVEQLGARGVSTVLVRANRPDTDAPDWFYDGWDEVFDSRPRQEDKSPLDALLHCLPSILERLDARPDFLLWIEIDRLLPPWTPTPQVFEEYLRHEILEQELPQAPEGKLADSDTPGDADGSGIAPQSDVEEPVEAWRDPPTGVFDAGDAEAATWLATSFGSIITVLDSELGSLFEQFRARGFDKSATWIVTSDFGYPLGEHGQVGVHRPWLHEELVHVPLLIRIAGGLQGGNRVQAFTQPSDVSVAVQEIFGSGHATGRGLLSLARGEVEELRTYAISSLDIGIAAECAIRTDDWAYLLPIRTAEGETREPMLYQKPDDHWEVNDLRARNIAIADELEAILKKA